MECPACSSEVNTQNPDEPVGVHHCSTCEAVFGQCYLGASFVLVAPYFAAKPVEPSKLRYFDLDCLGSSGVTRRHGWFDPETKLVHQTG